ncbi:MAG: PASTA domain-containing protein [Roseiflexaceae bacterium]
MNFLGGSLPNVMFIIGVLAIGLGLGIELKLVPLNKEIDKIGRIGAMVVGAMLVAASLYIYLNPSLTNPNQAAPTAAIAVMAPGVPTAANPPVAVSVPSDAPTIVPSIMPSDAPAPTATPLPTAIPPTSLPSVTVPDVHGLSEKEAQDALTQAGLQARTVDQCAGSDQGDSKAKKYRVQCQNPAANAAVPLGTTVEFMLR